MVYSVFCKVYLMWFNKEVKNGLNYFELEMINWKSFNSKNTLYVQIASKTELISALLREII